MAAADAPPASAKDNPAAPKTGTALLRPRFADCFVCGMFVCGIFGYGIFVRGIDVSRRDLDLRGR
jgi:hypothetical protein